MRATLKEVAGHVSSLKQYDEGPENTCQRGNRKKRKRGGMHPYFRNLQEQGYRKAQGCQCRAPQEHLSEYYCGKPQANPCIPHWAILPADYLPLDCPWLVDGPPSFGTKLVPLDTKELPAVPAVTSGGVGLQLFVWPKLSAKLL